MKLIAFLNAVVGATLIGVGFNSTSIGVGFFMLVCSINSEQDRHKKADTQHNPTTGKVEWK